MFWRLAPRHILLEIGCREQQFAKLFAVFIHFGPTNDLFFIFEIENVWQINFL